MIILSNSLVLSAAEEAFPDSTPWIGYHDLVETTNITSTSEDADFPVTNLANVATHLIWVGGTSSASEYLTVVTNYVEDIDYVGIAKHNFGSGTITVSVEGASTTDPYTMVLLHFDVSGDSPDVIVDDNTGGSAHTWTAFGNAFKDTSESVFGGSSLRLDGSTDRITTPDHADFTLGSGDWTVDFWFNCTATAAATRSLSGQCDSGGGNTSTSFKIRRSSTLEILATACVGASAFTVTGTTQYDATTNPGWHHLALVRTGNILRLFLDGVQEGGDVAITGTVNDSTEVLGVGCQGARTIDLWEGWIDEYRLSVGVARWTEDFTVPGIAYDDYLWEELVQETMPADDTPIIARFTPQALSRVRVRLQLNGIIPQAAVVYVGKLLVLERSITIGRGHVPINYGRRSTIVNGMSESGNFLGRIVLGEHRQSKAEFEWFTPDFYRSDIDTFLEAAQEFPFFWAWHPETYPTEVGYCWLTNNAEPEVDPVTQRVALTLEMRGVA